MILVPGYGGSKGALDRLAARIRATGREAVVLTLPGDGTGDLSAQARALQTTVRRELQHANSVDVIGYSAGGVVVRLWLADDGGANEARHVVTLGSPLHGANIAAVGQAFVPGECPVACQQLVPGSSLLNRLNATSLPAGVGWMSIWTTDDQTVNPPDSARLAGAINVVAQEICPGIVISHGGLPTDPLVHRPGSERADGALAGSDAGTDRQICAQQRAERSRVMDLTRTIGRPAKTHNDNGTRCALSPSDVDTELGQDLMSFVMKFAHAAPTNTTT